MHGFVIVVNCSRNSLRIEVHNDIVEQLAFVETVQVFVRDGDGTFCLSCRVRQQPVQSS